MRIPEYASNEDLAGEVEAMPAVERLMDALSVIHSHNLRHNDLEAYLYDMGEWGLGRLDERPNPADYGQAEVAA